MPTVTIPSEQLLHEAEEQLTAAERSGDGDVLCALLARDFAGHDTAGRPTTRDSFITTFTSSSLRFEQLATDETTYRIQDLTGIVCGRSVWRGWMDDRMFAGTGRFLDVWLWRDNRWQLLAAAVTPHPDGARTIR